MKGTLSLDFASVFRFLVETLQQKRIDFALVGGLALGVSGIARATQDIDLLIAKEDAPKLKALLLSHGYELLYESKDVANFVHPIAGGGRIDFLYAHRTYARTMLEHAEVKPVLGGQYQVKVLRIEDQIGMKVQSSSNDPLRYHQDMADIEALMQVHRCTLDLKRIKVYFELFDRGKDFETLRSRIQDAS